MGSDLNITTKLQEYILSNGLQLHPVQKEIIDYNKSLGDIKKMQISISQSQLLFLIVKISKIKKILEIGTFTGLSTLSMSLALPKDGEIVTIDKNENTNKVALNFFKKAKQEDKIKIITKPALETLNQYKNIYFDLIFIDADKLNYKKYYENSLKILNSGGLIIIDNVLWYGDVSDENKNDKITSAIKDFNKHLSKDTKIEKIIVPLGDGMTICRKI